MRIGDARIISPLPLWAEAMQPSTPFGGFNLGAR